MEDIRVHCICIGAFSRCKTEPFAALKIMMLCINMSTTWISKCFCNNSSTMAHSDTHANVYDLGSGARKMNKNILCDKGRQCTHTHTHALSVIHSGLTHVNPCRIVSIYFASMMFLWESQMRHNDQRNAQCISNAKKTLNAPRIPMLCEV